MSFQFGFQSGYQVAYTGNPIPAYNGRGEYVPTSHELQHINRLNKIEQLKAQDKVAARDLKAKELQIEALELQRLKEGLEDRLLQQELMALFLEQQQILLVKLHLERMILELQEEDEAIMIILLTTSF